MNKEIREYYEKYFPEGYANEQEKLDKLVEEKFKDDYNSTDLLAFITDFWVNSSIENNARTIYYELVRDGGNLVTFNDEPNSEVFLLLGASVTNDDYYYVCLTRNMKIKCFSCCIPYKKINIKHTSKLGKQREDDVFNIMEASPQLIKSIANDYFTKNKDKEQLFTKLYGC